VKDPLAPKKPVTGFIKFQQARIKQLKEQRGFESLQQGERAAMYKEIFKQASADWHLLTKERV
jgi:hypothetical protein